MNLADVAEKQIAKNADVREQNRIDFPQCSRVVDLLNAAGLGPVRVIAVEENGKSRGKFE